MGEKRIRVGVVGASGYGGMDLIRLLSLHPHVELTYVAGNHEESADIPEVYPFLPAAAGLRLEKYDPERCRERCEMVFVALPSGASGAVAAELWRAGLRVVDLSGDLRLPPDVYERWYQKPAADPGAIEAAVYGLTEWARAELRDARLVANPGCYPTGALLALLPAVRAGLAKRGHPVVIDAKSGVSGAGRHAAVDRLYGELQENFYPYKVGRHQHVPEIAGQLDVPAEGGLLFTAQLLPAVRGIYSTCYVWLRDGVSEADVRGVYAEAYADEPFIALAPPGRVPELKHVRGSNRCHIGLFVDQAAGVLQVFSVIDNLVKGAAGQAVQNFNVMYGFGETEGLTVQPLYP
ncbi:MAG: N-acetyl-gamma-glutamyl-phosphate reductase [Alicyclobacillaceae bacterium]|nr:N-acetyl-gamma-glutamyl-phosphate reductase [Alicyclobacillaceae bacterium]